MLSQRPWQVTDQQTWDSEETDTETRTVHDLDLAEIELIPTLRFLFAFGIGAVFFLVPVTWEGQLTVPFDIATSWVTATFPTLASVFSLALITAAGVLSVVAEVRRRGVSIGGSLARRIDLSY